MEVTDEEKLKLKEIVRDFAENYKKSRRQELPAPTLLEEELRSMAGIDEWQSHAFVYVPIESPLLKYFGSRCGNIGNKIFSNKSLISFLRNRNVESILGILFYPNDKEMYGSGAISLSSLALPIQGRAGHIFEHIVYKSGGSFRYEDSRMGEWSIYESE